MRKAVLDAEVPETDIRLRMPAAAHAIDIPLVNMPIATISCIPTVNLVVARESVIALPKPEISLVINVANAVRIFSISFFSFTRISIANNVY